MSLSASPSRASAPSLAPLVLPSSPTQTHPTSTPRAIPNPSRHHRRQTSFTVAQDDGWLNLTARELAAEERDESGWLEIRGDVAVERAVETLLQSDVACLLVKSGSNYGFFDYADLNTFLLLVLYASSPATDHPIQDSTNPLLAGRGQEIAFSLRNGIKVSVGQVCDISQKNPHHSIDPSISLRTILPLFASGLHRLAINSNPPQILTAQALLSHLVHLPEPPTPFNTSIAACAKRLNPLISLGGASSVLDAMHVMSLAGLSALGVLRSPAVMGSPISRSHSMGHKRRDSSTSSSSSQSQSHSLGRSPMSGSFHMQMPPLSASPDPEGELVDPGPGELVHVVTVRDCAKLVVPSEGKKALGMGLEEVGRMVQRDGDWYQRGEERVPIHTITSQTTLLHASHLILATSSSRVFIRPVSNWDKSPPISPTPSLSFSPSPSDSLSSLSLSSSASPSTSNLPRPPQTQLSPHAVLSILDVLSLVAHSYRAKLDSMPQAPSQVEIECQDWYLDPARLGKRRRASSSASAGSGSFSAPSTGWAARVNRA